MTCRIPPSLEKSLRAGRKLARKLDEIMHPYRCKCDDPYNVRYHDDGEATNNSEDLLLQMCQRFVKENLEGAYSSICVMQSLSERVVLFDDCKYELLQRGRENENFNEDFTRAFVRSQSFSEYLTMQM